MYHSQAKPCLWDLVVPMYVFFISIKLLIHFMNFHSMCLLDINLSRDVETIVGLEMCDWCRSFWIFFMAFVQAGKNRIVYQRNIILYQPLIIGQRHLIHLAWNPSVQKTSGALNTLVCLRLFCYCYINHHSGVFFSGILSTSQNTHKRPLTKMMR